MSKSRHVLCPPRSSLRYRALFTFIPHLNIFYAVVPGNAAFCDPVAVVCEEDMAEGALGGLHGRERESLTGVLFSFEPGEAEIVFHLELHGEKERCRGDEEGYRPAADLEGPSRVSREGLLYGWDTQYRQRRRHHHERRAECGSRREGRRREDEEVIDECHGNETARIPHFRICVPQVFRFYGSVQFLYRLFVKAELFFRLEVDQEDARPVDCHFFKAFHDVADLVDCLRLRFPQRLQYIVDDTVADAVAQKAAGKVGDGHEQDERRRDPLPCGESALPFRKGLSFFCQPFFFQDPPYEEKEKNDQR